MTFSTATTGRPGRPEDIGRAATFLMGSAYVTGVVLDVEGGGLLA